MIRPMDSIETYAYGINKDLACKKKRLNKKIQWNNTKIITFDDITREKTKEHNLNWPQFLITHTEY